MPGHCLGHCHLYRAMSREPCDRGMRWSYSELGSHLFGRDGEWRPYRDRDPGESKLNSSHWELTEAQKLETAVILVRVAWGGIRSGPAKETLPRSWECEASPGQAGGASYLRSAGWAPLSRAAAICKALIYQTRDMTDKMSQGRDGHLECVYEYHGGSTTHHTSELHLQSDSAQRV